MAEIHRSRSVAADPNAIWDVLADFGSISSWVDNIDHSCILNHGSEQITRFDTTRTLAYDVDGLANRLEKPDVRTTG